MVVSECVCAPDLQGLEQLLDLGLEEQGGDAGGMALALADCLPVHDVTTHMDIHNQSQMMMTEI
jgi:hypothetical protein